MITLATQWKQRSALSSPWWRCAAQNVGLLLLGCAFTLLVWGARTVGAAEKKIAWDSVNSEIREGVQEVTESVSGVLGIVPDQVNYHRNGNEKLPHLGSRDYDHSFSAWFVLRGVDKNGKQIPGDTKRRRGEEYGHTRFIVGIRNLKGVPPDAAVREMHEGRLLAEEVHALEMQSFWMMYNLVQMEDELKGEVDAIIKEGRRSNDPQARTALQARVKAQQQANQKEINAAVDKVEKQGKALSSSRASAKKREKEWQTAQDLRILSARESRLELELAAGRQEYEESVVRLRENAVNDPQLERDLNRRLERRRESFDRFETSINKELQEIAERRAALTGERVSRQETLAGGRGRDPRAAEYMGRRKRKVTTLRSARLKLTYHPGPSKLTSEKFPIGTAEGLELEMDSLGRRSIRSVAYYWPCGRYLVSVTMDVQRSILEWARRYDGQHRRVPFLSRRLEQAEAVKNSVAQSIERSRLCDGSDGYWAWTKQYVAKAQQDKSRLDEIRMQLDTLAKEKAEKREAWLELMRIESHKRLRDELRTEIRKQHERQRELIQEAEKLLEERLDLLEKQFDKSKKTRPQVERRFRAFQLEVPTIRLELYDAARWYEPNEFPVVLREFEKRLEDLGASKVDVRWQFKEWMEAKWLLARAEKLDEHIRLQRPVHGRLSGSAGTWYQTGRLLEKPSRIWSGDEAKAPGNPLVLAARTARQDAIVKLRALLEQEPANTAVQKTLRGEEGRWLRRIAGKLEVEKRASLGAFNQYLSNRGYDPKDTSGWWEGFKDYRSFAWGAGPITSLTAIPGSPLPFGLDTVFPNARLPGTSIPGSQVEATDRNLTRNAKHQLAMFAIMRLHDNGVPLADIPAVAADATKLAESMVLKNGKARQMSAERATQLGKDIRQTFVELDDLRALTQGNMDAFNEALAESHYETMDAEQSWGEFLGDALSPRHLLTTLGLSAVTRVGGKWVWAVKPKAYQKLTEGGAAVMRGRDSLVATLRLEKVGKWFAGTRGGKWLANKVIADQRYVADLKGWDAFVNSGSRVLAAMVIMGGGIHLAEQHGGVGGRLLAEALAELSAQEIAYDILSRSGTPLRKFIGEVDEFGLVLAKKQARLDDLRHVLGELNALTKDSSKLETMALERIAKKVDEGTGTAVTQAAVPETMDQGLEHAIEGVIEGLRKGDLAEAKDALEAAGGFAELLGRELPGLEAKVKQAKGLLAKMRTPVGSLLETRRPSGKLRSLQDEGVPPAFVAEERLYDLPISGRYLDEADDAFQRGDLEGAIRNYRRARRWAKRRDQAEMVGIVDDRLALAAGTEKAGGILARMRKRTHTIDADSVITDREVRELIEQFQRGRSMKTLPGGTSPVFEFTDKRGRRYVFKQLGDSEEMAAETAASRLAKALGIKAATARRVRMGKVKAVVDENGKKVTREIEAEGVLYRHIEGEKLSDLTEPVAAALKEDYAKQRVLRAWLGDPDIHFGNHLLGGDGHLWALDFGKANLKRKQLVKILRDGERYAERPDLGTQEYLDFIMNVPHLDTYRNNLPQYAWMARMDEMVHIEQMADTLTAVKNLVEGDGEELRNILRQSLPRTQVDETFEVLRERAAHLEAAMLKRFGLPSARLAKRAGTTVRPWMVREGEGKLPHTAAEARPGRPMVLDPDVSKTYLYVVKEDGRIVYAPQKYEMTLKNNKVYREEAVKHTDLAQAGPAKVGGEIKFEEGVWYMDAQSGRYSAAQDPTTGRVYATRTKEELEAAVELARRSGSEQTIKVKYP